MTLSNPGLFLQKNGGDSISWAGNSIVNYRNTSAAATDHDGVKEICVSAIEDPGEESLQ